MPEVHGEGIRSERRFGREAVLCPKRGVSVASAVWHEFGATGFWNRDALVVLGGRVLGLPACVGDG